MPRFVIQRSLYEVRERPSKAYSWKAFLIANMVVEIPYQILLGILVFAAYYYPIYGIQTSERQGLILLFCIQFFVFMSTFAHMVIAALPDAETAGNIATLIFSLTLLFNGVFQPPQALPGFWIFMCKWHTFLSSATFLLILIVNLIDRVSPLTYMVAGIAATGLSGRPVHCSPSELTVFQPATAGQTCADYLSKYLETAPGLLYNPNATSDCGYCPQTNADQFLASASISNGDRWRNYGLGFAYIGFNLFAAVFFYYFFRVRKSSGLSFKEKMGRLLPFLRRDPESGKQGQEEVNNSVV